MSQTELRRRQVVGGRGWCRVRVVDADGTVLADAALAGDGTALGVVDAIARLALVARRAGAWLSVEDARSELRELLELAALPVEVRGKAEGREEPLGLEEREKERHLGDPA